MLQNAFVPAGTFVAVDLPAPVCDLVRLCLRRDVDAPAARPVVSLGESSALDPLARWEGEMLQAELRERLDVIRSTGRAVVLAQLGDSGGMSCRLTATEAEQWLGCLNRIFIALRTRELGGPLVSGRAQGLEEFVFGEEDGQPPLNLSTAVVAVLVETLSIALCDVDAL